MNRVKVTVKNPQLFKEFLLQYTEGTSTNKYALWKGMVTDDYFRLELLKYNSNYGRPQIVGRFDQTENEQYELRVGVFLNKNVHVLSFSVMILVCFFGLMTLNLNMLIIAPILGIFMYLPGLMFSLLERKESLKKMDLIRHLASCATQQEMKQLIKK